MPSFQPCTLPPGADGDPAVFFSKVTGYGYNDMISLPTLTKESILENLKRRFQARARRRPLPLASILSLRFLPLAVYTYHS